jgi:hypothetical protein
MTDFAPMAAIDATETVAQWELHSTIFRRAYRLIDGTSKKTRTIMRRRALDGTWQYRLPTEQERGDDFYMLQW